MAQRNSSGRGASATRTTRQAGNQTPNTPGISESEISRMRVDDIRGQLRRRGVSGISALRKPDLVKTLARTLRAEGRAGGAARRSTGPSGRAPARKSAGATGAGKGTSTRRGTSARAKTPAASRAKTSAPSRAKATAVSRSGRAALSRPGAKAAPARAATRAAGVRTGRATSRSVRSSQLITSPADRPERPGRSLVTTNHQVIRNWAAARGARPATIVGTERAGRPGVLTFDLPGYRQSRQVRVVSWDDWFRTFDSRRLNLIFQEQLRDGRQSNFFRTESPDREDG
ncbi:hypothetical protein [Micromonospora sp. RL09-050-HVF-A]|uniref:hypothetical protein n=1 Tax=Micromonospora sp. RL09-050-HVF-A TaxID=1703433 RepID=UPI001C5F472E|nr:hypothetical protein [Micromonospora sp. RL09-050-HVF-A]MBW4703431.1 hypothetical protein [Micromonospora sp. RL09-050-HVF-A]